MKRLILSVALISACNTTGKGGENNAGTSELNASRPTGGTDAKALINGLNDSVFNMYSTVMGDKKRANENVFISPTSISIALGMTYLGARTNTEKEMAAALSFPGDHDAVGPMFKTLIADFKASKAKDGFDLTIANKIWTQPAFGFKAEFKQANQTFFGSDLAERDFKNDGIRKATIAEINQWAADNTNNKVNSIVDDQSVQPDTRIILANATYFLGDWVNPFPGSDPRWKNEIQFTKLDKKKVTAPAMGDKMFINYGESTTSKWIEMPYKGADGKEPRMSMVLVLPSEKSDLVKLEKSMNRKTWDSMMSSMAEDRITVRLPKWEVQGETLKLNDYLKSMKMASAFDDRLADFSGMTGQKNIYISTVLHKTFVRVDEKGTEAAAVTVVGGAEATSVPIEPPKTFIADRPFLYAIRDMKTGTILFIGRMINPTSKK